ncbi:MAG: cupin domain-containing protein [Candidatus Rokuibacteriota bacterium]
MSAASGQHGPDHSDLIFQHALRVVPSSDAPLVEAQLSECADCRREIEMLRPIVDDFASSWLDVLRPSDSLWSRLAQRIAAETVEGPARPASPRWVEPEWKEVAPGISCKVLATDAEQSRVSMLVRLAPGTDYPPHRHGGVEELHLLQGELIVDGQTFHPGDYRQAEAGAIDRRVWSETGCTCVLITSLHDALL